mmetsp:Transcript_49781/g.120798  ORF Transcript_49781/g.120798 Transcript_49781/m.120798 type:complete len:202 (-) Transcript_49781:97-702(-)
MMHSNRLGKVDPLCGKKGMVVSLDQEEYSKFAEVYKTPRIPGDEGPGELVQPFDEGTSWNVRWIGTGRVGTYYTGAPLRVPAFSQRARGPADPPDGPAAATQAPERPAHRAPRTGPVWARWARLEWPQCDGGPNACALLAGAFKLYHIRMGANDTDKTEVDLVMRDIRYKMEGVGDLHSTMPSRGTPSIMLKIPETAGGQQ